jgi:lactate dehydrogenase-like 2-hydroxyacid dehydrogenase
MREAPLIYVTRKLPEAVETRLERDYRAHLNPADTLLSQDEMVEGARDADAILCSAIDRWPAEAIALLPERLRAIATFSVGYEHIDLEAARTKGIVVTNTPDVLSEATADTAMLCLLGAARRAHEGEAMMRSGAWIGWRPTQLLGVELNGATLGIVGMGRIGQAMARRAQGFGMTVRYHNRTRLPAEQEKGAIFHAVLDDMLPHCRFLSLHCPATPETHRLLNARTLDLLPERAVVVNTARGPLIDDAALIERLQHGRIFAAGLDVYDGEPQLNVGYLGLANTFLLPHLGSATVETRNAMGFRCLDNLDAVFAGRPAPDALT